MNSRLIRIVDAGVVLFCTILAWSGSHFWESGIFWTSFRTSRGLYGAGMQWGWERWILTASLTTRRWSSSMISASIGLFGVFAMLHLYEGFPLVIPRGDLVFDFYLLLGFWTVGAVLSLLLKCVDLYRDFKQEYYWQPSLF